MNVLIYREDLFEPSETFVWQQDTYPDNATIRFASLRTIGAWRPPGASQKVVEAALRTPGNGRAGKMLFRTVGFTSRNFEHLLAWADIVHVHFAIDAASLLPALARKPIPLVVSIHGYDVLRCGPPGQGGLRGHLLKMRQRQLMDRASIFLASSAFLRESAIRVGYPSSKTLVHYVGVQTPSNSTGELPGARLPEDDEKGAVLIFAGRLVENKGVRFLPTISKFLADRGVRHRLDVYGDGPLRDWLARSASSQRLSIRICGYVPHAELLRQIRGAAAVLVPSREISTGESEALNLVALEAVVAKTPVVANAVGGIPEVVKHGVSGLLVPQDHEIEFCEAVHTVLTDSRMRRRLTSTEAIPQKFSRQWSAQRLGNIYRMVLPC